MADERSEKPKTYETDNLSRYAKLVTDGLLEAAGDDRAVQGKAMDETIKLESMTVLRFTSEDGKGATREKAKIQLSGTLEITTEEADKP